MEAIGGWITEVLERVEDESVQKRVKKEVEKLCERFPLYPNPFEFGAVAQREFPRTLSACVCRGSR